MEKVTSDLHFPVVLCHNDLLPGNIIYDEKRGELLFEKNTSLSSFTHAFVDVVLRRYYA